MCGCPSDFPRETVPLREASSSKSNSVLTGGGACGIAPLKDGTGVGSSGGWGPPASGRVIPDPCTARAGGRAHCMLTSRGQLIQTGAECRTRRSNRSVSTQKQPKRAEQRRAGYQQCTWVYFVPRVATRGETLSSTPDLIPTSGEQPALASTGPPPSGKMSRHLGIAMPSCVLAEP